MSSRQGTSRQGSSNTKAGAGNRNTQNTVDKITKQVKKDLGIVTMTGYKPNESSTVVATKAKNPTMFGGEVSQAVNEALVKTKDNPEGLLAKTDKGSYTNVINNKIVGGSGKKIREIKYGKSGGAMGSGDKTGVMGSIPISKQMYETQQKTKIALGLGAAAIGAPSVGLLYSGVSYLRKGAYDSYLQKFYGRMSDTSSLGMKRKVETDTKKNINRTEVQADVRDYDTTNEFQEKKYRKKIAGQGADNITKGRTLFGRHPQTISGNMN